MNLQTEKPEFALLLSTEESMGYAVASFAVITINDGEVRNAISLPEDELEMRIQRDTGGERPCNDGAWYSFEVRYARRSFISLRQAEEMVKVLRRVHRKLDKMNAELGYAEGVNQHVARFSKAVGAKKVYRKVSGGTSYDTMVWDISEPSRVENWRVLRVPERDAA